MNDRQSVRILENELYRTDGILVTQKGNCRDLWFISEGIADQLQGRLNTVSPHQPALSYVAQMLAMLPEVSAAATEPLRAWVLGLGSGSIAHAIAHLNPLAQLTVVEISLTVIEVAQRYFACPANHPQWRYEHADISVWLEQQRFNLNTAPRYIALDAYLACKPSPSVGSKGEYKSLALMLHPLGCLAVNLHEQADLSAHLSDINDAFEGRVKVHFVRGQGNPIAYGFGVEAWLARGSIKTSTEAVQK